MGRSTSLAAGASGSGRLGIVVGRPIITRDRLHQISIPTIRGPSGLRPGRLGGNLAPAGADPGPRRAGPARPSGFEPGVIVVLGELGLLVAEGGDGQLDARRGGGGPRAGSPARGRWGRGATGGPGGRRPRRRPWPAGWPGRPGTSRRGCRACRRCRRSGRARWPAGTGTCRTPRSAAAAVRYASRSETWPSLSRSARGSAIDSARCWPNRA